MRLPHSGHLPVNARGSQPHSGQRSLSQRRRRSLARRHMTMHSSGKPMALAAIRASKRNSAAGEGIEYARARCPCYGGAGSVAAVAEGIAFDDGGDQGGAFVVGLGEGGGNLEEGGFVVELDAAAQGVA